MCAAAPPRGGPLTFGLCCTALPHLPHLLAASVSPLSVRHLEQPPELVVQPRINEMHRDARVLPPPPATHYTISTSRVDPPSVRKGYLRASAYCAHARHVRFASDAPCLWRARTHLHPLRYPPQSPSSPLCPLPISPKACSASWRARSRWTWPPRTSTPSSQVLPLATCLIGEAFSAFRSAPRVLVIPPHRYFLQPHA